MYCKNCGAEVEGGANFCTYCGSALSETTSSISLINKAVATTNSDNQYNLVLVSVGSCNKTMAGDLLEDIFGYTDAESSNLIKMAPVVVGERLTAKEAQTVAQLLTEYGVQVSITNSQDQYVDLTSHATNSVFDSSGNLLTSVAAVIGALTVANRIRSYRRYKKPSLLERLFHIGYQPKPPVYRRSFRPHISPEPLEPRRTIRKPPLIQPRGPLQTGFRPGNAQPRQQKPGQQNRGHEFGGNSGRPGGNHRGPAGSH